MPRLEYSVAECPRWTKCTSVCNVCPDNCDHAKVTIQTEANEEGNTNGICNSCEATLLGNASTGWEVIEDIIEDRTLCPECDYPIAPDSNKCWNCEHWGGGREVG